MALAYALNYLEKEGLAHITNYGEYLEKHPPTHEVKIRENTSWSCAHGIERWRSDCGCNAGRNTKWNQAWRAPLREAMDWLRDTMAPKYEEMAGNFLKDPWAARDDYIEIILDRSPENTRIYLDKHQNHELNETEVVTVLKLLEAQRHAMLMYTSCGWFFDEISGIETVQVIQYAGRAVQLAQELFGDDIETGFLQHLEAAKSNIETQVDGKHIYEIQVKPSIVDLLKVAAHFAVSSLFEAYDKFVKIYCYDINIEDYNTYAMGIANLATGRVRISSVITKESDVLSFGVLHFGDHNVNAGVRRYQQEEAYQEMQKEMSASFSAADFSDVIRLLNKHFENSTYSIRNLFRDEQRKVINNIMESSLAEITAAFYQVYDRHYPPMRYLSELGNPIPRSFHVAADFILNTELHKALSDIPIDIDKISGFLEEIRTWKVDLDTEEFSYLMQQNLERIMTRFANTPEDTNNLETMLSAVGILKSLPFPVDLWRVQNLYHGLLNSVYPEFTKKASSGDENAANWAKQFASLGNILSVKVV